MQPLTESDLRAALVNASRGEAKRAAIPDLDVPEWEHLDYFGWVDGKRPLLAYVAMELDERLVCIQLRRTEARNRRALVCSWCQDVVAGDAAVLYAARRAGAAGRAGNTIGTAICDDFRCSANARREPSVTEMSSTDEAERQFWIDLRIDRLRERSARFVRQVMGTQD